MTDADKASNRVPEILHINAITPVQWLILTLCMIASMIEGFDIVVIAYTAPAISQDLNIASSELGMVFSAGVFGMTLGAMFLASLADRYGRRIVVSSMLFIAGLATFAIIYSETAAELIALRAFAGIALGALVATLPALIGEYSPSRYRTLIISIMIASANFGGFAGGLIVAEIIDQGWRQIFLYAGAFTMIIALMIQFLIPESPVFTIKRNRPGALEQVNKALSYIRQPVLSALPSLQHTTKQESSTVASLLTPERRSTTLLIWCAFFLAFLVVYFISSWMPQILSTAGLSQQQAIQGSTALPLGAIAGNILIGWLAARWPLGRLITIAFLIGAISMAILGGVQPYIQTIPFLLIWLILFITGVSVLGAFGNLYNVSMAVYPVHIRGTGLGWSAGLGRAGAVSSPILAGFLVAAGLSTPTLFFLFAAPALIAAWNVSNIKIKEL